MPEACNSPGLMPLAQALLAIEHSIKPLTETETVALGELPLRVLAEDILSPIDVPGYDNSAMDGYALRHQDLAAYSELRVVGKSFAGAPFAGTVAAGECVRIMTGAVIPAGTDTVVMQENVDAGQYTIRLTAAPKLTEAVRRRGEDIARGAVVLSRGHCISPVDIGLLASIGIARATVFRKIRVGLFSTGDELRQPGTALDEGCIYDANRPALHALLLAMGAHVNDYGVVEDSPGAIREAFARADRENDAVITSGGVSVGEADYTRDILQEIGDISFWKLAIKPGKPLAFGRLDNSYFFGLPGNPVSAIVTLHQVAMAGLARLAGKQAPAPLRLTAIVDSPFRKSPGRLDFQRASYRVDEAGQFHVTPCRNQSSGVLSSFSQANCYVVLEAERGSVEAGEAVALEPFNHSLSAR